MALSSIARSAGGLVSDALSTAAGSVFDLLDPSKSRRAASGLLPGGASSEEKQIPNIGFEAANGSGGATSAAEDDWRVRISLADQATIFYKDPGMLYNALLSPLKKTNGVIFPYTPTINVSHLANYTSASLTHSNYAQAFYNNSEVSDIQITGDFTVQSAEEGQYLIAAIYFFRAATKMFFGQGNNVGNPPPIVFLDGYGSHYLPHVPCVITNFSHTLSNDVDYVQVPVTTTTLEETTVSQAGPNSGVSMYDLGNGTLTDDLSKIAPNFGSKKAATDSNGNYNRTQFKSLTSSTWVPTTSSISITVKPVYSRKNIHDNFNLESFAAGGLLQNKDRGTGGFI